MYKLATDGKEPPAPMNVSAQQVSLGLMTQNNVGTKVIVVGYWIAAGTEWFFILFETLLAF